MATTQRIYVHRFDAARRSDDRRNRLAALYGRGVDAPVEAAEVSTTPQTATAAAPQPGFSRAKCGHATAVSTAPSPARFTVRVSTRPPMLRWSCPRPVLVADVLGHADVKTTRRYARSELEDRRAALEALDQ